MEIGSDYQGKRPFKGVDNGSISYVVDCIKSFESKKISINFMVENLSASIVVQYMLMKLGGDKFRQESAGSINNSMTYLAIRKLKTILCEIFFKGNTCVDNLVHCLFSGTNNNAPI